LADGEGGDVDYFVLEGFEAGGVRVGILGGDGEAEEGGDGTADLADVSSLLVD